MRIRISTLIAIVLSIVAPTVVAPLHAQPSAKSRADPKRPEDPRLLARQHVAAARVLHAQHKLGEAMAELEAAYALDPRPSLLFAMGQLHVQLGDCDHALVFYRRFLDSKPKREDAGVAREAIDTCRTAPPAPPPPPPPRVVLPVVEATPPPPAARPAVRPSRARPSYVVAGSLVTGGIVAGVGSVLLYRSANRERDRADMAPTYDAYEDLIGRASYRHTAAMVTGVASVAALTGGVIAFVWTRRVRVAATPTGASVELRMPF